MMHDSSRQIASWPVTPARYENAAGRPNPAARHVAALTRAVPRVVERARAAGVEILPVPGLHPLFNDARVFAGGETDWVLAPERAGSPVVVPRAELRALQRLAEAGIDFPLIFVAHEIRKGLVAGPTEEPADLTVFATDPMTAAKTVGPVPPPVGTVELSDRLGRSSQRILELLARTGMAAGAGAAAAASAVAGAAAGAFAGLDPIVFGVLPAGRAVVGQPAAWFILARWEW